MRAGDKNNYDMKGKDENEKINKNGNGKQIRKTTNGSKFIMRSVPK